jgi:hypothetical protein
MSAPLYFLPWLRRGLGLELGERDTGQDQLPRGAPVSVYVDIDDERAVATLALRPPDHATGIDAAQIIRRYPQPNTVDAEYGYFPLIELSAPDLPWVLTPAVANEAADDTTSTGRLRPWVVLVCVEEATADLVAASADRPARLIVPVGQLPDLAESHAWVHVQSIVPADEVVDSLSTPGTVVARLVCPRRLVAGTTYRAALVLAFAADGDLLEPAWNAAAGDAELTVYDTWTFTTGEAGSFEELCRRLGPIADEELELGLHTMDVTDLGSVDPWPTANRVTVDYTGALCDAEISPAALGSLKDEFDVAVIGLLDQACHRVDLDPDEPDPVVTPPFFGSLQAEADEIPSSGWLRQLNLVPNRRAAAGLGAEIVRVHQERFMAEAWRQAGAIREANRELSATRLQAEIGRTWKHRANRLAYLQRVAVLRSQLTFVRDEANQAPRRLLEQSTIPDALVSPAYLRAARPGAVVATAAATRGREPSTWREAVATSFGSAAARREMAFGVVGVPRGTLLDDKRALSAALAADDLELAEVAALTVTGIRPLTAARSRLEARIPILSELLSETESDLPSRIRWGPAIDEALMWSLVELSAELLMPGVGQFPQNSVRVVETDPAYVASLLAGANHEMSRELLWREFPADIRSTTFRRFWDRPDVTDRDIIPIAEWPDSSLLGDLGAAGSESVVLLVRGDLVMHYPSVRFLLVEPTTKVASLPSFSGWIAPDVRFVGFDVESASAVTAPGSRWKVVIEEQPSEPRFGLDTDPTPADLADWSDLAWEHLNAQADDAPHLIVGAAGFPSNHQAPGEATWGLNSAHMARVTYQAPFRMTFRVVDLVGEAE